VIFVGDDWAEAHHDVHVMNEAGEKLATRRLPEGLEGISRFHELVAGLVDDVNEVVVGIETDRGLWVHALAAAGYQVYALNPMSVARYRDHHQVSGAKSDAGDAKVPADLVRTDRHNHRPISGDSPEAEAIKVLTRAHQSLIWARTRHTNQLRNALPWKPSTTWEIVTRWRRSAALPHRRPALRCRSTNSVRYSSGEGGNATSTSEPARSKTPCDPSSWQRPS
jgi:hypothetical protein